MSWVRVVVARTTLGRAMVRLIEPTGGTIEYEYGGTILQLVQLTKRELRIARRDMNMIYQDPYSSLNPRMNIRNIIAEPIVLHKEARGKQLNDRIAVATGECEIEASCNE